MKYSVYARVTGSKFIGEFEARTEEEAIELAEKSDEAWVSFCHQCSGNCEDPETSEFVAEKSE
jgi:hypothetical protein